jgi:hypothetical protein
LMMEYEKREECVGGAPAGEGRIRQMHYVD